MMGENILLLMEEKYRKLLTLSSFMSEKDDRLKVLNYLQNPHTDQEDTPKEIVSTLNRFRDDWIQQSMSEWNYIPGQHIFNVTKKFPHKKVHCDLCNAPLSRKVVFVQNTKNGKELHIGVDCAENILLQSVRDRAKYYGIQYERHEKLEKAYPGIFDFLNQKRLSDTSKYELSSSLLRTENKIISRIRRVIKLYCEKDVLDEYYINELLKEIPNFKNKVNGYLNRQGAENGLSLQLRERLRVNKNPNREEILKLVRDNDGMITTPAAILIEDKKYLNDYAKKVNDTGLCDKLSKFTHVQGTVFNLEIKYQKHKKINLKFSSKNVISHFGAPVPSVTNEAIDGIINDTNLLIPCDNISKEKSFEMGINFLANNKFDIFFPSFQSFTEYVQRKEINISQEDKTILHEDKYTELISEHIYLIKNKTYYKLSKADIIKTGLIRLKKILLKSKLNIPMPKMKIIPSVFDDIYNMYQ